MLAASAPGVAAQASGALTTEENFRAAPNGAVIVRLAEGTRVAVLATRERWLEVEFRGWVWTRSLQSVDQSGFDLIVSEAEGENLRDAPQGAILGRLERGTLLHEIRRQPGWIEVRRTGYLWGPSVDVAGPAAPEPQAESRPPTSEAPAATRPGGFATAGEAGTAILTSPDGDTLALTVPRSELEITQREGNWVRVRVEGWAWMPEPGVEAQTDANSVALTPADLARDPEAHVGRVVSWRLQFVSVERAEAVRTDFLEREPFLLSRFGGDDGPFVYVAVPPQRVAEVEGLLPLEFLLVTGRVRTGASSLTGTPIVDLLSFERVRPGR